MKTFGKIIICIIVVLVAIGIGYLASNGEETSGNTLTNTATNNTNNNVAGNTTTNEIDEENKDYIGEEENKEEEPVEEEEPETNPEQNIEQEDETTQQELTGKEKAVDIVKKQYALDGQTVEVDHMEGENYVIKIKDGTAATWWYLVDGTTWEAEEY